MVRASVKRRFPPHADDASRARPFTGGNACIIVPEMRGGDNLPGNIFRKRFGDGMATMIVRFQVEDFDRWKRMFDDMQAARREHGIVSASVHRNAADPEMVVTILRTASVDQARAWGNSETLHDAMAAAGVTDVIEIEYLEDVE